MIEFPEIEGERISLVHLNPSHLNDMFEYSRLEKFYEHLEFPSQKSLRDTEMYFQRLISRSNEVDAKWWFIRLNETQKVIGTIGLSGIDMNRCCAEVSYGLSPDYWKMGYFSESLALILIFSNTKLGLVRVSATTSTNNSASISSLKKQGFEVEGILKNYYRKYSGEFFDAAVLAKIFNS